MGASRVLSGSRAGEGATYPPPAAQVLQLHRPWTVLLGSFSAHPTTAAMQDPAKELPGLIHTLLQAPADQQRALIERHFASDCRLTHALVGRRAVAGLCAAVASAAGARGRSRPPRGPTLAAAPHYSRCQDPSMRPCLPDACSAVGGIARTSSASSSSGGGPPLPRCSSPRCAAPSCAALPGLCCRAAQAASDPAVLRRAKLHCRAAQAAWAPTPLLRALLHCCAARPAGCACRFANVRLSADIREVFVSSEGDKAFVQLIQVGEAVLQQRALILAHASRCSLCSAHCKRGGGMQSSSVSGAAAAPCHA